MESKMYGYVYLITNKINNKKYVGLRASSEFDASYWGSGKLIKYAIDKYGIENFTREILHWCDTPEELSEREVFELVDRHAASSSEYYNIIDTKTPILFGNDNGFFGKRHTDKTKQIISEKNSGSYWSDERRNKYEDWKSTEDYENHCAHLSEIKKGKSLSTEHKDKIRDSFTEAVRNKISDQKTNFYSSEQGAIVKKKLSDNARERFTGVSKSDEHKNKISAALTGKTHEWQDKINKNTEKIRKTAAAHTGMTRSDSAKKNMSLAKKGKSPHNIGKKYYYNPAFPEEKTLCSEQDAPQGWINGIYKKR